MSRPSRLPARTPPAGRGTRVERESARDREGARASERERGSERGRGREGERETDDQFVCQLALYQRGEGLDVSVKRLVLSE